MAKHENPRIQSLLNATDDLRQFRHPLSILQQQEKIQNMIDTFLPDDHDDLLNGFEGGEVIKSYGEEIIRPYISPARIAMAQALMRFDSSQIKSLILKDLLSEFTDDDFGWLAGEKGRRIATTIYILGQGPFQNDQKVLDSLRGVLRKENLSVQIDGFWVFIPMLGEPVSQYRTHELAGFSLINLGDFSKLEEILFAQFEITNGEQSKDKFVQWVYSLNKPATIQALNSIASYNPKTKQKTWFPQFEKMASALEKIGEEDCIEPLSILYDHGDTAIKITALKVLGKIGGERALVIISKATEDKKSGIRRNAKKILRGL